MKVKKYIEIRPGAGGKESENLVQEITRVYLKYCNKNNIGAEIINDNSRTVEILIEGDNKVIKAFNNEVGVHRVQRVPETERKGRVHTSTFTVAVLDILSNEKKEKYYNDKDIKIDIYKSSGAGGQHRNKVETAIRVTHIPTGIVVISANERSQLTNKKNALDILNSKLKELNEKEKFTKHDKIRANQVKKGNREESRRTYNYQRNEVYDEILNEKKSLKSFLKGELFL